MDKHKRLFNLNKLAHSIFDCRFHSITFGFKLGLLLGLSLLLSRLCHDITNINHHRIITPLLYIKHSCSSMPSASLFRALEDYSVDNRGDVGSWIREAAMIGLERCTYILCKRDSSVLQSKSQGIESGEQNKGYVVENDQMQSLFDANLAETLVGGIVKQAVEKMDKIRDIAAKVLQRIVYNETIFVPFLPHREILEEVVPNEEDVKWAVPTFSYRCFVKLLKLSCYSKHVLSGLVISIGGLQESLRKTSLDALLKYLQATEVKDKCGRMSREFSLCEEDIIWVLQKYKRSDRVIIPTLKTIEILFSKRVFLNMEMANLKPMSLKPNYMSRSRIGILSVNLSTTPDHKLRGVRFFGCVPSLHSLRKGKAHCVIRQEETKPERPPPEISPAETETPPSSLTLIRPLTLSLVTFATMFVLYSSDRKKMVNSFLVPLSSTWNRNKLMNLSLICYIKAIAGLKLLQLGFDTFIRALEAANKFEKRKKKWEAAKKKEEAAQDQA